MRERNLLDAVGVQIRSFCRITLIAEIIYLRLILYLMFPYYAILKTPDVLAEVKFFI